MQENLLLFQWGHEVVIMLNRTLLCYHHALLLWKPFTNEPHRKSACSIYLRSESFHMCQWRQWLPDGFDWLSSYCATPPATVGPLLLLLNVEIIDCDAVFYVTPSWRVFRTEDLRIQCDTETVHGSLCCSLPMCPLSTRPSTPSGLRETLAFELLSCHFLLSENREMRREHWPIQICPPVHPSIHESAQLGEWTHRHIHTAFRIIIRQLVRRC